MAYQTLDEIKYALGRNEIYNVFSPIYDIILKVSGHLDEAEKFETTFSPYLLVRYLSMNSSLMQYAEILNMYQDKMNKKDFYRFAYSMIPKSRNCFWKYIKKAEKKAKVVDDSVEEQHTTATNMLF